MWRQGSAKTMNRQKTARETYQSQKEDELSFWAGDQIIMFSKPNSEGNRHNL